MTDLPPILLFQSWNRSWSPKEEEIDWALELRVSRDLTQEEKQSVLKLAIRQLKGQLESEDQNG